MHIAHIHTNREWGGGEHQVLHLLGGLRDNGDTVTLICEAGGPLAAEAAKVGIAAEPPAPARDIARLVKARAVDLIHVHDSAGTSLGGKAGRLARVPVVLTRRVASPLRRNAMSRRKYSPRRLAAVIAISETVKEVFLQSGYPEARLFVVPSGLDFDALEAVEPDDAFRDASSYLVMGVGKLSVKKNWRMLVDVAAAERDAGGDVRWVIAGDGPERQRLEARIADLKLDGRVLLAGFRQDALALLKAADLLFFPSVREGASVTVRQAMALGVPVVAVDAAGTRESLAGHGRLVNADDIGTAARAVLQLLNDAVARQAMAVAAQASARARFSIEDTIRGTRAVYEQILGDSAGGVHPR